MTTGIIIFSYCAFQIIAGPVFIYILGVNPHFNTLDYVTLNPIQLYENTRLNWFGSWCIAIFLWIVFAPWAMGYWIYKAFTVGKL